MEKDIIFGAAPWVKRPEGGLTGGGGPEAVIFAEMLDFLVGAPELLNEESESQGFRLSFVKTKIQNFNDILDAAILPVPVCGVEVTERFTYLGSDIHVSACCEPEVNRHLGYAWGVKDSLDHGVWHC